MTHLPFDFTLLCDACQFLVERALLVDRFIVDFDGREKLLGMTHAQMSFCFCELIDI